MKYVCKDCSYRFNANVLPKTCPYCNKEQIEEEKNAEELVEEVQDLIE